MRLLKLTVCGGGNGAQVLASVAAQNLGCAVDLYAPCADEAVRLTTGVRMHHGLETRGVMKALGRPRRISANPEDVIPGSELVILVVPAFAHERILRETIPFLEKGAWLGAIPARGGFDYCAARRLEEVGRPDVRLFGLQTLPWACRIQEYGQIVQVLGIKNVVDAACRPAAAIQIIAPLLEQMLGLRIGIAATFLALTLANVGQLIHPGIMHGLFGTWDGAPFRQEQIPHFYQGVSKHTAQLLARLSSDIQKIRRCLDAIVDLTSVRTLHEWLRYSYGPSITDPSSLRTAFVTNPAYAGLRAPVREVVPGWFVPDFEARYLSEDVPYGLAVSRAVGRLAGVETPTIDRVIGWAGERLGKEYLGRDAALARIPQCYGLRSIEALVAFAHEREAATEME